MKRIALVLLILAAGLCVVRAAEKADPAKAKKPPATTTQKSPNSDPEPGLKFEKPEFDLPGGMTGTIGTIDVPEDPLRPGYRGPNSDTGPRLPAGGLIFKKKF